MSWKKNVMLMYEIKAKFCCIKENKMAKFQNVFFTYITDLSWSDNKIFWVSSLNKVSVYDRILGQQREVEHISDATSVAYDWLGQKLYWSNPVQNVVSILFHRQ